MRTGVIGLGNIGAGVARNLVRAGVAVIVFDLDPRKVSDLVDRGADSAGSAVEAAREADVVFTSLPGPQQIATVGLGSGDECGILSVMRAGAIWVDLSTSDLETARSLDARAAESNIRLIDAPVSGGPEGAEAGTLSILVGGEDDDVSDVLPLFEIIGARIDHLGPRGTGIVAKIAQVTLCYTQTITLIEALILGAKGGVDPERMLELIQHSAGRSYVSDVYGPEILAGTYDASFPIGHATKDMRLAMKLADSVAADLPFMSSVAELYEQAESIYGSTAAHLRAAHLLEDRNRLFLHDHRTKEPHDRTSR